MSYKPLNLRVSDDKSLPFLPFQNNVASLTRTPTNETETSSTLVDHYSVLPKEEPPRMTSTKLIVRFNFSKNKIYDVVKTGN